MVDTGGLVFDDDSEFLPLIRQQAELALQEATAAIFVVDGQTGPTALDHDIARWLRQLSLPILVAVNKCESRQMGQVQAAEFWSLGLGEPYPVSSIHGSGTGDLLDQLITYLPVETAPQTPTEIQVAIAGRPNVGKSSLLNALIGSDRAIVSPISGTTRDTIDTVIERNGVYYRFIDTAGIRKRSSVAYGPEMFSVHRAFKAIHRSDVVLLVLDALEEITEQDQRLAGHIADQGRACVLIMNKWDAVAEKDTYTINTYRDRLYRRLNFLDWAEALFISAKTGQRLDKIFTAVDAAVEQHRRRVSTAVVNEVIQDALRWHSPPPPAKVVKAKFIMQPRWPPNPQRSPFLSTMPNCLRRTTAAILKAKYASNSAFKAHRFGCCGAVKSHGRSKPKGILAPHCGYHSGLVALCLTSLECFVFPSCLPAG
nr:ribosome biogenesis GTPase Der [Thermostichus lividus]